MDRLMDRKQAELEQGRAIAAQAEEIWGWGTPAGRLRAQRRASLIIIRADIGPGQDVLEIGCGTGVFTEHFAETGANVTALDLSPDLLNQAKARIVGVVFRLSDAECLPFGAESFDAVVGSSILHHVNLPAALSEVWRVLRIGGRIAFTEPNMLNPQIMLERNVPFLRHLMKNTPYETAFFRWKLAKVLWRAGFVDVSVKPFDFLHPWMPTLGIAAWRKVGMLVERLPGLREIAGSLVITARRGGTQQVDGNE